MIKTAPEQKLSQKKLRMGVTKLYISEHGDTDKKQLKKTFNAKLLKTKNLTVKDKVVFYKREPSS